MFCSFMRIVTKHQWSEQGLGLPLALTGHTTNRPLKGWFIQTSLIVVPDDIPALALYIGTPFENWSQKIPSVMILMGVLTVES